MPRQPVATHILLLPSAVSVCPNRFEIHGTDKEIVLNAWQAVDDPHAHIDLILEGMGENGQNDVCLKGRIDAATLKPVTFSLMGAIHALVAKHMGTDLAGARAKMEGWTEGPRDKYKGSQFKEPKTGKLHAKNTLGQALGIGKLPGGSANRLQKSTNPTAPGGPLFEVATLVKVDLLS